MEVEHLQPMLAASAWASGARAVEKSVGCAVSGLGEGNPALVLLFPEIGASHEEAVRQARAVVPSCPLAGMSSEGLITADGVRAEGCSAIVFSDEISAGVGLAREASTDPYVAGRAAAQAAMHGVEPAPGHGVLLLLVDPESGDEAAAIDGAYSVAGGRVPLAGGGANGPAGALLAGDSASDDAVVAVLLSSPSPISVAHAHGCRPRGVPAIATRTEGRALRELNGRPAEDVYLEGLGRPGEQLDDDEFESLAVLHPLAQPELRGVRLRHVHGRADGGGLACATPIPPNAAVWFTEQSRQTIVDSAVDAVRDAVGGLSGPPRAGLVFDCAARKRALGDGVAEEADAVVSAFDDVPTMTGLYTRGEVARTRGAKGDRNHAIVVVAFQ